MMKCDNCIHKQLCPIRGQVRGLEQTADKFFRERVRQISGLERNFELKVDDCTGYKKDE